MQNVIVFIIVTICALFFLNRFLPIIGKAVWFATVEFLKLVHAPASTQQWALKHYAPSSEGGCCSCDKCDKCH